MLTSEKLVLIREKIDKPEKWCKGAWHIRSTDAYCIIGAAVSVGDAQDAVEVLYQITAGLTNQSPPAYNDSHTHAEVLAVVDRAIEIAKEQEVGIASEFRSEMAKDSELRTDAPKELVGV